MNGTLISSIIPSMNVLNAFSGFHNPLEIPTIPATIAQVINATIIATVMLPFLNDPIKPFSNILPDQKITPNNAMNNEAIGATKHTNVGSKPSGKSAFFSGVRGCTPSPRTLPVCLALVSSVYIGPMLESVTATNTTATIANKAYMLYFNIPAHTPHSSTDNPANATSVATRPVMKGP